MTLHNSVKKSKKIAIYANMTRTRYQKHLHAEAGLTLIELMVGIAIGLLVVAVATAALMGVRSVTGTVSDVTGIQQQAAYVMRTFGTQLRQAGSLYLDLGLDNGGDGDISSDTAFHLRSSTEQAIFEDEDGRVITRFTGYEEPTFANNGPISRNCLGAPGSIADTTETIESIFTLVGNDLRCGGNGATSQAIANNVAEFRVSYLVQVQDTETANPSVDYQDADDGVDDWSRVQGVEVCLVLFGSERIDLPTDAPAEDTSYTGCNDSAVNLTTLAEPRTNRMHYVFRNVFQLRSQGLI